MEPLEREVFEFPTLIGLKVIGRNKDNFEAFVVDVFRTQVTEEDIHQVESRLSKGDTYLSVTVTFLALSREHLDAIYHELGLHPRVMMVL